MRPRLNLLTVVLLVVFLLLAATRALAATPIELVVFHSELCGSCQEFDRDMLPSVQAAYGDRLVVRMVDVATADGLAELEAAEAAAGSSGNPLPVLLVDGELLADQDLAILSSQLSERLSARLGPPVGPITTARLTPAATVQPQATVTALPMPVDEPALHVAYVSKAYCDVCDRTRLALDVMQQEFPQLVVHEFDQADEAVLIEAMGVHLGLPSDRRMIAPSIYVGEQAVVGDQISSAALRSVLNAYRSDGTDAFWDELDTSTAGQGILSRFQSMSVATVMVAALIDGVNPCAFATILFFVSYLAISRRQRGEMLLVGLAFAAGVFVAYFAVGLGAMRLLSLVEAARGVGLVLYALMAVSCFVLAVMSLKDYVLARQGRLDDMHLNLPEAFRTRIHQRIRAGKGAFWGAAFISGIVVSLLELACTGQVYLPTISYVISVPGLRASGVLYLLLYNLIFILPLLVVVVLAAYGVRTRTLQSLFVRHAASAKLGMAVVFTVLGVSLLARVATL